MMLYVTFGTTSDISKCASLRSLQTGCSIIIKHAPWWTSMPNEKQKQVGRAYRRKLHIKPVKEGSEPRYVKILNDKS